MLKKYKRKDGMFSGYCEVPNCKNKIITPSPKRKYCKDCTQERYKHSNIFYKNRKKRILKYGGDMNLGLTKKERYIADTNKR